MAAEHHKRIGDMRSVKLFLGAALIMGVAIGAGSRAADKDDKKDDKKPTVKEIMKLAHEEKVGLLFKAKDGTIKDDEKKKLVAAYVALADTKPSKGDEEMWKKITSAIAKAAKDYGDGKDEKAEALTKTLQCRSCHQTYR
jgi:hypothetical protein